MKKLLLLLFAFPFILVSCSSDDGDENGGKENSYLYEIIVKEHVYKFGEASSVGETYEMYRFTSSGNLLKKETNYFIYGQTGRINHSYEYTYDDKERLIDKKEYTISLLDYRYIYSYNSIDSISEMKKYSKEGKLLETWTYEYDNLKRLKKATSISNINSSDFGYVHNYSYEGNNIIDSTYMFKDGTLFGVTLDEYDSYGNLTGNTWTNGSTGKKTKQKGITYEYNSNGKITKETLWSMLPDDLTYKNYTYDKDGKIQKIHVSYSYKTDESDLIYEYIYK